VPPGFLFAAAARTQKKEREDEEKTIHVWMDKQLCKTTVDIMNVRRLMPRMRGGHVDKCVLYAFRCAVYYSSNSRHDPERLKWWNWSGERLT
jgi:hypothetical protein